jgi:hypothetical protein
MGMDVNTRSIGSEPPVKRANQAAPQPASVLGGTDERRTATLAQSPSGAGAGRSGKLLQQGVYNLITGCTFDTCPLTRRRANSPRMQ